MKFFSSFMILVFHRNLVFYLLPKRYQSLFKLLHVIQSHKFTFSSTVITPDRKITQSKILKKTP
jgi:hypothetical protein